MDNIILIEKRFFVKENGKERESVLALSLLLLRVIKCITL